MPTEIYQYHYEDCYGCECDSPLFNNLEAAHAWFEEASAERCTHECGCFNGRCNSLADQGKDKVYPQRIIDVWPDEDANRRLVFGPYHFIEQPPVPIKGAMPNEPSGIEAAFEAAHEAYEAAEEDAHIQAGLDKALEADDA